MIYFLSSGHSPVNSSRQPVLSPGSSWSSPSSRCQSLGSLEDEPLMHTDQLQSPRNLTLPVFQPLPPTKPLVRMALLCSKLSLLEPQPSRFGKDHSQPFSRKTRFLKALFKYVNSNNPNPRPSSQCRKKSIIVIFPEIIHSNSCCPCRT